MATKHSCREIGKILKFWILEILGFLLLTLAITSNVSNNDLEIMNLLKKLNKPYVKSIKSPDGSIIDCVLLHLQPAFDNPLLKNHTLQMQPSFFPEGYSRNRSSNEKLFTQPWHAIGRCPEGTTPIRRTTKADILRAKSIQSYGKKTRRSFPKPNSRQAGKTNDDDDNTHHEYAVQVVEDGNFYGTKADLSVWTPYVEAGEFSLGQIWVSAGEDDVDLNTIEAGYQIYEDIYEDNSTHLFAYWTRDAYQNTGCYNLECDGFVQISRDINLGSIIIPTSEHDGAQIEMSLYIYKDRRTGNWFLKVDDKLVGYWPSNIFTHLQNSATSVNWGGEVTNSANGGRHTETEMGSGIFSSEGYGKSAYFMDIQVVDQSYHLVAPVGVISRVTNEDCYDLTSGDSENQGEFFYYGGPGRNQNCP